MRRITMTWDDARWEPGIAEDLISYIESCLVKGKWVVPDRFELSEVPMRLIPDNADYEGVWCNECGRPWPDEPIAEGPRAYGLNEWRPKGTDGETP